jgi:hypothetical protein
MHVPWFEMEPMLCERAYGHLDNDPQILLEHDAWFDLDADLFHARLIGFDGEVVKEVWVNSVMPVIMMPIYQRLALTIDPTEIAPGVHRLDGVEIHLPVDPHEPARYVLQSGFATLRVSGFVTDPPVERLRDDMTAVVAFLRYKRRS